MAIVLQLSPSAPCVGLQDAPRPLPLRRTRQLVAACPATVASKFPKTDQQTTSRDWYYTYWICRFRYYPWPTVAFIVHTMNVQHWWPERNRQFPWRTAHQTSHTTFHRGKPLRCCEGSILSLHHSVNTDSFRFRRNELHLHLFKYKEGVYSSKSHRRISSANRAVSHMGDLTGRNRHLLTHLMEDVGQGSTPDL